MTVHNPHKKRISLTRHKDFNVYRLVCNQVATQLMKHKKLCAPLIKWIDMSTEKQTIYSVYVLNILKYFGRRIYRQDSRLKLSCI